MPSATPSPIPPGATATVGPVSASERFDSLDLLRGVAILGILVMNIYAFAMPFAAYFNPYRMGGEEPWNLATWAVTHVFFDQKFMAIFSMLLAYEKRKKPSPLRPKSIPGVTPTWAFSRISKAKA